MITYVQGDLFNVESGILAHACNYNGIWGGGIAGIFRRRFPKAFETYRQVCEQKGPSLLGSALLISDGDYRIACLFTNDYTTVEKVYELTKRCLEDLQSQITDDTVVNMPKINSGIFSVPWEITEKALQEVGGDYHVYVLE